MRHHLHKIMFASALVLGVGGFAAPSWAQSTDPLPTLSEGRLAGGNNGISRELTIDNGVDSGPGGVNVTATIDKDKDKRVVELIAKLKIAVILVANLVRPDGAAEAEAVVNQTNDGNTVDQDTLVGGVGLPWNVTLRAAIRGAINGNTGIVQVNQDVGNMVNQGNVLALALTTSASSFADSQASAQQNTTTNNSALREASPPDTPQRTTLISESINRNTGITMVNQNSGNMNNQLNAAAIAIGRNAVVALSETDLGQFNTGNKVGDNNTHKQDLIINSVNGNTGITAVNQSTGSHNNQATVISFSGVASF